MSTSSEEHFAFNLHLTLDSAPFHTCYDMRGNMTKLWTTYGDGYVYKYYWDARDLLTKVTYERGGVLQYEVSYKYDAFGRRVARKEGDGPWRWYFYDGLKIIAEGTGTTDRKYYTLAPGAIGGIICSDEGGEVYYYHYL